jgi:flagellar basal-body rod modification protein FlgD
MAVIGGVQPTSATSTKTPAADIFSGMGPDAFLKLLVAQIRYQNPMSPSDPTAMMGQIAQYAQVEALTKLQQGQGVDQSLSEARMATDLVGKVVTASDGSVTQTGKVLSARFTATGPVLVLDSGSEVTLSAVTRVDQAAAAVAAPAAPAAAATPAASVAPAAVAAPAAVPAPATPTAAAASAAPAAALAADVVATPATPATPTPTTSTTTTTIIPPTIPTIEPPTTPTA